MEVYNRGQGGVLAPGTNAEGKSKGNGRSTSGCVWKCLGEAGIGMLWGLMQKIYEKEKMLTERSDSVIVQLCKEGDIVECSNYWDIHLMPHTNEDRGKGLCTGRSEKNRLWETNRPGFMPGRDSRDDGRNIGGSTVDAEIPGKADRTTYYYDLYWSRESI